MSDSSDKGAPRTPGIGTLVAAGVLVLGAAFVFGFLPRVSAPPVVTTAAAHPPTPAPRAADPLPPGAEDPPSSTAVPAGLPDRSPRRADPIPTADEPPPPGRPAAEPASGSPAPGEADVWAAAVTEGQGALERAAFAEARDAFARAEAARPGTASVKDGLARLLAAEKASTLGSLQRAAQDARAREDWKGALAAYDAAQRLEPAVAFAVEGRVEAAIRLALDEQLSSHLGRPDRLSAEAVAREAEIALDRAAEIEAPGPRLARQIADLRAALAAARTGVSVRLVSDGHTDVTLLRVGRLGVFKAKTVELRPGAYVLVGTRKGYRDARVAFEVPQGGLPEPVRVRCDEAL